MAHDGEGGEAAPMTGKEGAFRRESWRGTPGFFRAGRTVGGTWWLVAPDESPFLWRGVNDVGRGRASEVYAQMVGARFGSEDHASYADDAWRRLTGWGFNAIGPGAGVELADEGRPYVVTVGFREAGVATIRSGGTNLPDVFDPKWPEACAARAAEVAMHWRGDRDLLGYVTDDALHFAPLRGKRPERPSLLQLCLSLEPAMAAYHAAWEFTLAPYGGELAALAAAWGVELPARPVVRQWTQADRVVASAGYRKDDERFTREFARRYFGATTAALRAEDGNHLVLGGRFAHAPGAAVLAEAAGAADVVWLPVDEIPAGGGPVLRDGFAWHAPAYEAGEPAELSSLERMLRGGRAALERVLRDPACVGYTWAAWRAGNAWAVPPWPAGLVFDDDRPVLAHVEPLRSINLAATAARRALG